MPVLDGPIRAHAIGATTERISPQTWGFPPPRGALRRGRR